MIPFDWNRIDAALFDLDGVVTDTASLHFRAWKETFDEFLRRKVGNEAAPFEESDYLRHVDGKPRYDGVAAFLASRGIELPRGTPDDAPGFDTVCALGNLKNERVNALMDKDGIEVFDGTVELIRSLRLAGRATALVSSSANAPHVLDVTGLASLFDAVIDGGLAHRLGLRGKPQPDTYLEAARRLDVAPGRAVVVEDAESGVEAGVRGGFAAVIGVARSGNAATLVRAGATVVVEDLGELERPA